MKKFILCSVLIVSLVARAEEKKPAATESPLAPLASLVGGVWIGDVPVPKDQPSLKLEARFVWTDNKQGIRFQSTFVRGDQRVPYTDGMYAWNATKGKLVIFYVNNDGDLTEGTIADDHGVLANELLVTEPSGKTYPVRVRLTKVGADVFTNEIFLQKDGAWAPFVTVRYERQK